LSELHFINAGFYSLLIQVVDDIFGGHIAGELVGSHWAA
jgi:hypothetical protein